MKKKLLLFGIGFVLTLAMACVLRLLPHKEEIPERLIGYEYSTTLVKYSHSLLGNTYYFDADSDEGTAQCVVVTRFGKLIKAYTVDSDGEVIYYWSKKDTKEFKPNQMSALIFKGQGEEEENLIEFQKSGLVTVKTENAYEVGFYSRTSADRVKINDIEKEVYRYDYHKYSFKTMKLGGRWIIVGVNKGKEEALYWEANTDTMLFRDKVYDIDRGTTQ